MSNQQVTEVRVASAADVVEGGGHRNGPPLWDFKGLLDHIWFDTCVYHQPGIDLLVGVVPLGKILFMSEMVVADRGVDPATGNYYDDTKIYIDNSTFDDDGRRAVYDSNIRRVYPRLQLP